MEIEGPRVGGCSSGGLIDYGDVGVAARPVFLGSGLGRAPLIGALVGCVGGGLVGEAVLWPARLPKSYGGQVEELRQERSR